MRDYGKVHTSFWTSDSIRELSEDARMLALYLLTCPHATIAGVFRLPDGYACEDLQWSAERVREGFAELFAKGFANRCETTKWVWIRKYLEWNPPENPNQRKAAAKCALLVPDSCAWKLEFSMTCGALFGGESSIVANPCETVSQPFANQEQEQEQEKRERRASPLGSRLPPDWTLPDEWRTWAEHERPDVDVALEAAKFRDFWHGKPGKDGRKADWQATWRNWVRRAEPGRRRVSPAAGDDFLARAI